jgi:L-fucose mutarotase/ribose pyranase (RbsD/FucU family)
MLLAVWFARQATTELLLPDTMIIFKLTRFDFLIIGSVMGAVLSALKLMNNLHADITLYRTVGQENKKLKVEKELNSFIEEAWLPGNTQIKV